jgi:hypothetical protein
MSEDRAHHAEKAASAMRHRLDVMAKHIENRETSLGFAIAHRKIAEERAAGAEMTLIHVRQELQLALAEIARLGLAASKRVVLGCDMAASVSSAPAPDEPPAPTARALPDGVFAGFTKPYGGPRR